MTENEILTRLDLRPRLLKIAQLVPNCHCLADIGTDHAYIPVWATATGVCELAIASDINRGPLTRAKKNVLNFGLNDRISLRLGAGLSTLTPGEADTIVIAGMGGILISNILESSKSTVSAAKTLILQPMTAVKELREYLTQNGFCIDTEHLIAEDDKIYNILCIKIGGTPSQYSESELILGRGIETTSGEFFEEYKNAIINKYQKQLSGLEMSKLSENKATALKVKRQLDLIKQNSD